MPMDMYGMYNSHETKTMWTFFLYLLVIFFVWFQLSQKRLLLSSAAMPAERAFCTAAFDWLMLGNVPKKSSSFKQVPEKMEAHVGSQTFLCTTDWRQSCKSYTSLSRGYDCWVCCNSSTDCLCVGIALKHKPELKKTSQESEIHSTGWLRKTSVSSPSTEFCGCLTCECKKATSLDSAWNCCSPSRPPWQRTGNSRDHSWFQISNFTTQSVQETIANFRSNASIKHFRFANVFQVGMTFLNRTMWCFPGNSICDLSVLSLTCRNSNG